MVIRKRLDLTGPAIAFITTTVFDWKPILNQKTVASIILEEIKSALPAFQCSMISYVIMPSHIHLLMRYEHIEKLSKCTQSFKSITSRRVKQLALPELADNDFKLWKPRFDDLIIQSEKQLKIKMEYIHNNPVKAGLVKNAPHWPYSSATDWLTTDSGPIRIDKDYKEFGGS